MVKGDINNPKYKIGDIVHIRLLNYVNVPAEVVSSAYKSNFGYVCYKLRLPNGNSWYTKESELVDE